MKENVIKLILKKIRKNAERGAGMASELGMFEAPVPKELRKQEKVSDK